MANKDNIMEVFDDKGNKIEMTILFTTTLDTYNKNYVFYFDEKLEEPQVFVSSYDETGTLSPVEDEEEWNQLNDIFNQFQEEQMNCENCNGNCDGNCQKDCDDSSSCCGKCKEN